MFFLSNMELLTAYNLIIAGSTVIILSHLFGELSRKTNIPSVLMLIVFGILLSVGIDFLIPELELDFLPILEVLGTVGLIMIVLEAALELELKREKYIPIAKALLIALIGLLASAWVAAWILHEFVEGMDWASAWLYATPLSILSSAIIIPSVTGLPNTKKEFHIYESTFSDILGIMVFYFLLGQMESPEQAGDGGSDLVLFAGSVLLTLVIAFVASYVIVLIFQNIRSHVKLFLLIAVLILLYVIAKRMHLSSLIIILIFGLLIANMRLFFRGPLARWLDLRKAKEIYEGLHLITMETAFVVRTFFFVIFGLTIDPETLTNPYDALVAGLIILSIYALRYVLLRIFIGKDIFPQLFIAPRGLITVLLFYVIISEEALIVPGFDASILLYVIIGTSVIMTIAMIRDKRRTNQAIRKAQANPVGYTKWKAPNIMEISEAEEQESAQH